MGLGTMYAKLFKKLFSIEYFAVFLQNMFVFIEVVRVLSIHAEDVLRVTIISFLKK